MSKPTTTASGSSPSESRTASSTKPLSSVISAHSSVKGSPKAIREWLMSSRRDFPASRSAQPVVETVKVMKETYGPSPWNVFASSHPGSPSWRMFQGFSRGPIPTGQLYSGTWPKAGSIVDGYAFRHMWSVPRKSVKGSGFWYRPTARDWKGYTRREGESLCNQLKALFPESSGKPCPEFISQVMGWPTGWSGLKPLETAKFQRWLRLHGKS